MRNIIHCLLMGICLAASSNALASGFYLGGGGGYQHVKIDGSTVQLPAPFGPIRLPSASGSGGVGLAFVGYEFAGDTFALGLEVNAQPTSITIGGKQAGNTSTTPAKFKSSWGANVRPGIFITRNVKVFGAIGWQQARLEERGVTAVARRKQNESIDGLYLGTGAEFILPVGDVDSSSSVALRVEYAHVNYSVPLSRIRTNGVLASLVWRFS